MLTKEKIAYFIHKERNTFRKLTDPCIIFGSAGLLLSGLLIPNVQDLDILTTRANYDLMKEYWQNYIHTVGHPYHGKKFKSSFLGLQYEDIEIELMADFCVNARGTWQTVEITDTQKFEVDDVTILFPTLAESVRLLKLFNREKDKQKLALVEHNFKNVNYHYGNRNGIRKSTSI